MKAYPGVIPPHVLRLTRKVGMGFIAAWRFLIGAAQNIVFADTSKDFSIQAS